MLHFRLFASALLTLAGLAGTVLAQTAAALENERQTVSGAGVASISRPPETMRLQVTLLGRGSTLKDALAVLKDRVAKAKPQLLALGADKDSIKVEDSRIAEQKNDRNQQVQMQMMMMARMKRGGKGAKPAATTTPPVVVSAVLTAEWKLTAKTSDELLLAIHPVQEKIKAADLAGSKDAEKLTPEQEEMLEEAQNQFSFNQGDEAKPGEPVFLFVSRISEAEEAKAMAEAFAKAKQQAAGLAKAAGAELGGLMSLSGTTGNAGAYEFGGINYNSAAYSTLQMLQQRQLASNEESDEAVGLEPTAIKKQVSIQASFALKLKK